jgi:hypothetical protein
MRSTELGSFGLYEPTLTADCAAISDCPTSGCLPVGQHLPTRRRNVARARPRFLSTIDKCVFRGRGTMTEYPQQWLYQ